MHTQRSFIVNNRTVERRCSNVKMILNLHQENVKNIADASYERRLLEMDLEVVSEIEARW
jgi:hypothetical protein